MSNAAAMLDPFRSPHGDIFAELAAAARSATAWEVAFRPAHAGSFPARVLARRNDLLKLERDLAAQRGSAPDDPQARALHDVRTNPRLLRSGITAATIKPRDMERLPRVLLPKNQDEPRAATICAAYIRTVRGSS